jgi:hypothetical protein
VQIEQDGRVAQGRAAARLLPSLRFHLGTQLLELKIPMARYSTLIKARSSVPGLRQVLLNTLASCDLDLIYENDDYLVAKERPTNVNLSRLATVEVLINPPTLAEPSARVNLVVTNEELPLKRDNHCQRLFELVNQALASRSL